MIRQFHVPMGRLCRTAAEYSFASLLLLFVPSHVRADDPEPFKRRANGDLAIRSRAILKKYCSECHNNQPDRRGTVAVLEYQKLVAGAPNPVRFVDPRNESGSQIIQFIEDGSMPPGNRPRPDMEEIAVLRKWIAESAPSYPAAFDEEYTLKVMLDDIDGQPAELRPYLRYFSLAHLLSENGPLPNLGMEEKRLELALRWCNLDLREPPQPVDGTATLFRFDMRTMGWDARGLFVSPIKDAPPDASPLKPYDLILLEYPHGYRLPLDHPQTARLNQYFKTTRLIQPIPFLRADWLAEKLARGKPLADDLKSLTELRKAFEKKKSDLENPENIPCGPKMRAFLGNNPESLAIKPETGIPILPLGAWYSGNCRTDPAPFTLTAKAVNKELEPIKSVVKRAPFLLQAKSDRKIYFVLLMVWSDGTVVVQPTNKNGFLNPDEETTLFPGGGSTEFKIEGLLKGGQKVTEYFVFLASQTEIPTPLIVKSRHADTQDCRDQQLFPISRFFFDPETKKANFDPSRVVRVVVPIDVLAK
jgi:hypothetical protein